MCTSITILWSTRTCATLKPTPSSACMTATACLKNKARMWFTAEPNGKLLICALSRLETVPCWSLGTGMVLKMKFIMFFFVFFFCSGEDFYTCVTMEKRGENVMEFQLSGEVAPSYNESLCHNSSSLTPNNWVTQGSKLWCNCQALSNILIIRFHFY